MAAFAHVSNALGTVNCRSQELVASVAGTSTGPPLVIDGAQAVLHGAVDVQERWGATSTRSQQPQALRPDGYRSPVRPARTARRAMPPYQGRRRNDPLGHVRQRPCTTTLPYKFEAGTPTHRRCRTVCGAADGVPVQDIGLDRRSSAHETDLLNYGTESCTEPACAGGHASLAPPRMPRSGMHLVHALDGVHPHDIGTIVDAERGSPIRTGHHCAQPVMERFGVPATARASLASLQHPRVTSTRWSRCAQEGGGR